jgi:hypothetical protein
MRATTSRLRSCWVQNALFGRIFATQTGVDFARKWSRRAWAARLAFLVLALFGTAHAWSAQKHRPAAQENWITYRNARFGFRVHYPAALFDAGQLPENGGGQTFNSKDGHAKIVVFAAHNPEKYTPAEYRKVILEEFGGYDRMDYSPTGQSWFVLSGFRGENTYYQKVMFSCGNGVINALSITFPTAEKPVYERLIEIIEDNFKPGRGADTPQGC